MCIRSTIKYLLVNNLNMCTFIFVGNTVVAAAVYGPVEVRQHKLLIDRASIDVCYHCRAGPSSK